MLFEVWQSNILLEIMRQIENKDKKKQMQGTHVNAKNKNPRVPADTLT